MRKSDQQTALHLVLPGRGVAKPVVNPYQNNGERIPLNRVDRERSVVDSIWITGILCGVWFVVHNECFGISRVLEQTILDRLIPGMLLVVWLTFFAGYRTLRTALVSTVTLFVFGLLLIGYFYWQNGF